MVFVTKFMYLHVIDNRQQSGKPQQQHKSRRRLPLLTTAFRKHCSRSFDSGISYLLTDTSHTTQQTSPPMDDVLNEEEEVQHRDAVTSLEPSSPRHQPWSPSKLNHQVVHNFDESLFIQPLYPKLGRFENGLAFRNNRHKNWELTTTAATSRPRATPDLVRVSSFVVKEEFHFRRRFQFGEKARHCSSYDFTAAHGPELFAVHRNEPDDAENTFANFEYAFF